MIQSDQDRLGRNELCCLGHPEITFLTFILAPMLAWNVMLIGASFYGLGSGSYMSCLAFGCGMLWDVRDRNCRVTRNWMFWKVQTSLV
jgi:hypothetical protein